MNCVHTASSVSVSPVSGSIVSALRLRGLGMQRVIAFSPFLTWRPSSRHRG